MKTNLLNFTVPSLIAKRAAAESAREKHESGCYSYHSREQIEMDITEKLSKHDEI